MTERQTVELREERKVVSALFADLVGSTALGERLDPEEVRLVVGEAVARIVGEVEKLGGHVKDLAGDGVLAFFGAPVASEDDAERAVRAGLAIARAIAEYGAEVERSFAVEGFGVRVGIGTGPVVLGSIGAGERVEYAAFGDTVNTAARLQAQALPGMVLVDGPTQRLVAPLFDWSDARELELKGKTERVTTFAVAGVRPAAGKPRGLEGAEARIVGRDGELASAREVMRRLEEGAGGLLLITGEAGIGKSRLLAEVRESFDGLWLEGRCVSYGDSLPYWPFRDLLRELLGVSVDEPELRVRIVLRRQLDRLFGMRTDELYPYLASLLGLALEPEAEARTAQLSPEALQYRTFEVVGTLLSRLADERPLVVSLEDLHWADTTSVQLVERLLPVAEAAAVVLALSQRDDRDHPSWALKEVAARDFPHVSRELALQPLSGDAERELLHALVGINTLPADLERRILHAAEGNPFFLEELVRSLSDAGALVADEGRWRFDHEVDVEIPPTVERVILARIDRLSPECHDALTAASVLGRRFGLGLLEGVLGEDGFLHDALHELQRLDLLRAGRRWPEPEYRFKHALIQEATYRTLLSEQRTRLHRKAAEWLEARSADSVDEVLGLLAHHWLSARDEGKAIAYLTRAGDRARGEWALDEAIEHYQKLLPLLERRGERQEMALVLFKLGLALHTALRFAEANTVYQQAFELWTPPVAGAPTATLRIVTNTLAQIPDPPRSYNLSDIQLQMSLFDRLVERWPEATIVPALAEHWQISDDGLHYVFRLRDGVRWSDGTPLTAHDVEYGIKRGLDPARPGVSVSIYYVLENAQDYALGRNPDVASVGVRALDDRTVEFRLAAPAPYFLSVVNRPDGGPQPRHAIERDGDAWIEPDREVVSGAFNQVERTAERVVLQRREATHVRRTGNVRRVELLRTSIDEAARLYGQDEADIAIVRASERLEPLLRLAGDAVRLGPPAGCYYLALDHSGSAAILAFRRALAHAVDRDGLAGLLPPGVALAPATGGIVPPALQGHTPDIAPPYDPELARRELERSGVEGPITVASWGGEVAGLIVEAIAEGWRRALRIPVEARILQPEDWVGPQQKWDFTAAMEAWFPGYPDPEYFLRLLLHSEASDNAGHWSHPPFDELIERARSEPDGRRRLELFHEADRMAVAEEVAVIPLLYGRSVACVKPWVRGWWEFGKTWSSFADLEVGTESPRFAS